MGLLILTSVLFLMGLHDISRAVGKQMLAECMSIGKKPKQTPSASLILVSGKEAH